MLTGVYYIPALRNSIISLGQLDESGSRMVIDSRVLRIWDHRRQLLARVVRGKNRLYILHVGWPSLFVLQLAGTTRHGSGTSALGTFTLRP